MGAKFLDLLKSASIGGIAGFMVAGLAWCVSSYFVEGVSEIAWWWACVLGLVVGAIAGPWTSWLAKAAQDDKPAKPPVLELMFSVVGAYGAGVVPAIGSGNWGVSIVFILCFSAICIVGMLKLPYNEIFATRADALYAKDAADFTRNIQNSYSLKLPFLQRRAPYILTPLLMEFREKCDARGGVDAAATELMQAYDLDNVESVRKLYLLADANPIPASIYAKYQLAKKIREKIDHDGDINEAAGPIADAYSLSAESVKSLYTYAAVHVPKM